MFFFWPCFPQQKPENNCHQFDAIDLVQVSDWFHVTSGSQITMGGILEEENSKLKKRREISNVEWRQELTEVLTATHMIYIYIYYFYCFQALAWLTTVLKGTTNRCNWWWTAYLIRKNPLKLTCFSYAQISANHDYLSWQLLLQVL